jgi:hypothetical protein
MTTITPSSPALPSEEMIVKIAKRLAGIYDRQEKADGRPGGALAAYNAGVSMTIDFWNRMASTAIAAMQATPETGWQGEDGLAERLDLIAKNAIDEMLNMPVGTRSPKFRVDRKEALCILEKVRREIGAAASDLGKAKP